MMLWDLKERRVLVGVGMPTNEGRAVIHWSIHSGISRIRVKERDRRIVVYSQLQV